MNEYGQKVVSTRNLAMITIFFIISIVLFPISLVGYVIWIGKGVLAGNLSGVSVTAQGPLFARWLQHRLGVRRDEAANGLMMALPGVSRLGLRLVAGPTLLVHKLSGYVPRAFRYPFEGDIPSSMRLLPAKRSSIPFSIGASPTSRSSLSLAQVSTHAHSDYPRTRVSDPSRSIFRRPRRSNAKRWRGLVSTRVRLRS